MKEGRKGGKEERERKKKRRKKRPQRVPFCKKISQSNAGEDTGANRGLYSLSLCNIGISQKTKNRTATLSFYKGIKVSIWWKYLHTHVYGNTIHHSQTWSQHGCPLTHEWIKNMWHIYTMEYSSNINKNKIMSFAGKWMEPEIVV
jgi:hypothetical protein